MAGWDHIAGYGEVMQGVSAQAFFDANTGPKAKRTHLPMPWPGEKKATADVTPDERAALKAQLEQYSAFAH